MLSLVVVVALEPLAGMLPLLPAQREATRGGSGETIAATAPGANESRRGEARWFATSPALLVVVCT
jgi:hypothetical protein